MQTTATIENAVAALRKAGGSKPEIGLILGSGLGDYAEQLGNPYSVSYREIAGHPVSSIPGHKGRYVGGERLGKQVLAMQGRFHSYEGYAAEELAVGVRTMHEMGVKTLIITNAAGGIHPEDPPGTIRLVRDHINYAGVNPLTGPNADAFGPRFPDMTNAYDRTLREKMRKAAAENGLTIEEGVYIMFAGPSYETPAEIRLARLLGADTVGMSTVPEVIAAAHCGMKVLCFSLVTNHAAGILDQPLSHDEVQETATIARERFTRLIDLAIGEVC